MSAENVRTAYAAKAHEYSTRFGSIDDVHAADQELVREWAQNLKGTAIDAGCGPGQWTNFIQSLGVSVEGVDLVPEFVDVARGLYPGVAFRVGYLEKLEVPGRSVAGILAWYSVIHTPPYEIHRVLAEFARCIAPGGSLLLGFFEGHAIEAFPHAVTPAYQWPVDEMTRLLSNTGFTVVEKHTRVDPGTRTHAAIIAHRIEY
ncbi:class I SAM-dependent methyltransferase [Arthrobacter cavernae]|uniref:Class I SAM-dependent methyltransferase n=1 Tax=Arthrobacter cavernae TaxID=2817681 RepID=A0A939H9B4_9MICC|nr:class I SAM-dependent methyltransferase [Arthrobacter cavernae]MBO1266672.1 class I SAM-dependent methyltransferase [Arthrobacter cavernae]